MIIPQSMKNYVMNIPTHEGGEDVITICVLLMRGFLQKGHPFSDRAYDSSNIETLHDVISGKATIDLNQNIIKYTTGKERRFIMHSDSAGDIAAEYIIKIIKLYNRYLYEMTPEDYRKGMIGISTMIDNIFKFETSDSFADIKTFMYMYAEESRSMNINNYKNNIEAIRTLVRRAMSKGYYEGVNLYLAYCDDCGHQELEMDVCPKCGSKNLTKIDRMNGYLSYSRVHGDTRLNDAKMAEIAERVSM